MPLSRVSQLDINLRVQSVCSTEKPGKGLQAWAAKVRRQRNSRLVRVAYQMDVLITTCRSMARYDRQVSSLRKRAVHRGFLFSIVIGFTGLIRVTSGW